MHESCFCDRRFPLRLCQGSPSRTGEAAMTASGGNLIVAEVNRKGALPRAGRGSRDYDSAVRARNITVRWTVATFEIAEDVCSHSLRRFNTDQIQTGFNDSACGIGQGDTGRGRTQARVLI